jgi:hypothetical protein
MAVSPQEGKDTRRPAYIFTATKTSRFMEERQVYPRIHVP